MGEWGGRRMPNIRLFHLSGSEGDASTKSMSRCKLNELKCETLPPPGSPRSTFLLCLLQACTRVNWLLYHFTQTVYYSIGRIIKWKKKVIAKLFEAPKYLTNNNKKHWWYGTVWHIIKSWSLSDIDDISDTLTPLCWVIFSIYRSLIAFYA